MINGVERSGTVRDDEYIVENVLNLFEPIWTVEIARKSRKSFLTRSHFSGHDRDPVVIHKTTGHKRLNNLIKNPWGSKI